MKHTARSFFEPASTGIVPQLVTEERLQPANALLRVSLIATRFGGAAIGGLLVALIGPAPAIAVDAGTYLISAVLLIGMWLPPAATATTRDSLGEAQGGLGRRPHAHLAVGNRRRLSTKAARPLLVANAARLFAAPYFVLAGIPAPLPIIAAPAVAAGSAVSIFGVLWHTTLQLRVPRSLLSRVSAYDSLGSFAVIPLGAGGPCTIRDQNPALFIHAHTRPASSW